MHYTLGAIPPTAFVSAHLMAFGGVDPGVPLDAAGMPGCMLYVDLAVAVATFVVGSPTATHAFAVPYDFALLGLQLDSQGIALVPGSNALGIVASNGVVDTIGAQ